MSLAHPGWFAVALVLGIFAAYLYRRFERRASSAALLYSDLAFMVAAARPSRVIASLVFAGWIAGLAALALAAGGPHMMLRVPSKDGSVMLCIDTSGSMSATDIEPTRSDASRAAAHAFVDAAPAGTKIGIISFSSSAQVIIQPSADRAQVADAIDHIPDPNGATAIGDAIDLAAQSLPKTGRRVIVLLTDGVNNRGVDPLAAAKDAGDRHIPVFTVGIGTSGSGLLIPGTDEQAELDEDALRAIADDSGGKFAMIGDAATLRTAFGDLARNTIWEKKLVDSSFPLALGGAVVIVVTFLAGFGAGRFP